VKLKLDENLGKLPLQVFLEAGHDVATVRSQQLSGTTDKHLISVCRKEGRCLVTLDMDFGNPLIFPPEDIPAWGMVPTGRYQHVGGGGSELFRHFGCHGYEYHAGV
jgi:hypothetical protein